jgi:uncharacterized protein
MGQLDTSAANRNPSGGRPSDDRHEGKLAVITGASSGIGLELARIAARHGYSLVAAAQSFPADFEAVIGARSAVTCVEADLSTSDGVAELVDAIDGRPVELLCANAGEGLGEGFLDQDFDRVRHMIDTNVTGTLELVQQVARAMRSQGRGRILFTGSIAGLAPGPFQAAYGGTKAFINSFAEALRQELADKGVSVTVLMPGATDTRFFARAGMTDTRVGAGTKQDPKSVAEAGWQAVMAGDDKVVAGAANKAQALLSRVIPATASAKRFGHLSEPGGAREGNGALLPLVLLGGVAGALALLARGSAGRARY